MTGQENYNGRDDSTRNSYVLLLLYPPELSKSVGYHLPPIKKKHRFRPCGFWMELHFIVKRSRSSYLSLCQSHGNNCVHNERCNITSLDEKYCPRAVSGMHQRRLRRPTVTSMRASCHICVYWVQKLRPWLDVRTITVDERPTEVKVRKSASRIGWTYLLIHLSDLRRVPSFVLWCACLARGSRHAIKMQLEIHLLNVSTFVLNYL